MLSATTRRQASTNVFSSRVGIMTRSPERLRMVQIATSWQKLSSRANIQKEQRKAARELAGRERKTNLHSLGILLWAKNLHGAVLRGKGLETLKGTLTVVQCLQRKESPADGFKSPERSNNEAWHALGSGTWGGRGTAGRGLAQNVPAGTAKQIGTLLHTRAANEIQRTVHAICTLM